MPQSLENKRITSQKKRAARRAAALRFLGGSCALCDSVEELDFDHIDPSTKFKAVSQLLTSAEDVFWTEVRKCQLLCVDHHKAKTAVDRGYRTERYELTCPQCCGLFYRQARQMRGQLTFCGRSCNRKYYSENTR